MSPALRSPCLPVECIPGWVTHPGVSPQGSDQTSTAWVNGCPQAERVMAQEWKFVNAGGTRPPSLHALAAFCALHGFPSCAVGQHTQAHPYSFTLRVHAEMRAAPTLQPASPMRHESRFRWVSSRSDCVAGNRRVSLLEIKDQEQRFRWVSSCSDCVAGNRRVSFL